MKAKVLKRFRDKDSGVIYKVNSVYESNEKRLKELQKLGYVGKIEKPKKTTKKEGE